jgi:hypothetical protein
MTNAGRAIALRLQHLGLLPWEATVDSGRLAAVPEFLAVVRWKLAAV